MTIHAAPVAAQEVTSRVPTIPPPAPPSIVTRPVIPFPDAQPVAEHAELYDAMRDSVDENAAIESMLGEMVKAWLTDPTMAELEARSPGTLHEAASSMRPILVRHMKRVRAMYEPQLTALFARYLTPAEAASMAEFYRSETGMRFTKLISRNLSASAVMEDYATTTEITRDQLDRDNVTTVTNTLGQMSPWELAELERQIATYPVMQKLRTFSEPMRRLQLAAENEPMLKEDELAAERAMTEVLQKRFR